MYTSIPLVPTNDIQTSSNSQLVKGPQHKLVESHFRKCGNLLTQLICTHTNMVHLKLILMSQSTIDLLGLSDLHRSNETFK